MTVWTRVKRPKSSPALNYHPDIAHVWPSSTDAADTDPRVPAAASLEDAFGCAISASAEVAINELSARLTAAGWSIVDTVKTHDCGAIIAVSPTRRAAVRIELKSDNSTIKLGQPLLAAGAHLDNPVYTRAERSWRWLSLEAAGSADGETLALLARIVLILADVARAAESEISGREPSASGDLARDRGCLAGPAFGGRLPPRTADHAGRPQVRAGDFQPFDGGTSRARLGYGSGGRCIRAPNGRCGRVLTVVGVTGHAGGEDDHGGISQSSASECGLECANPNAFAGSASSQDKGQNADEAHEKEPCNKADERGANANQAGEDANNGHGNDADRDDEDDSGQGQSNHGANATGPGNGATNGLNKVKD